MLSFPPAMLVCLLFEVLIVTHFPKVDLTLMIVSCEIMITAVGASVSVRSYC
jgi:hypothetical protein